MHVRRVRVQLAKRSAAKEKATKDLEAAREAGSLEDIERFSKRLVRMDKTHTEDCKRLLRLMGMPVVEAPCEAEAQCAALARADKVYAAASEDMDTLTFGTPRLVRKMWATDGKTPIMEFNLPKVLAGLDVTMEQFIDVCILAGCDYCEPIKGERQPCHDGVGPQRAEEAGVSISCVRAQALLPPPHTSR